MPPSPASLLLGVVLRLRRRRRSWELAAWRSQRRVREVEGRALTEGAEPAANSMHTPLIPGRQPEPDTMG